MKHSKLTFLAASVVLVSAALTQAESRMAPVTPGYMTDCPMKENATLSVRYNKQFNEIDEAISFAQSVSKTLIETAKKAGSSDVTITSENYSLNMKKDYYDDSGKSWMVNGSANATINNKSSKQAILEIAKVKGLTPSLRVSANRPHRCKK